MIEADLISFLNSKAAITNIVGSNIFATHLPQGATKPALSVQWISRQPSYHLDGEDGVCQARVQIDLWSHSYSDVLELAEAVRNCLSGFHGAMGSTNIRVALVDGYIDINEPPIDQSDNWLYRRAVDYLLYFDQERATP